MMIKKLFLFCILFFPFYLLGAEEGTDLTLSFFKENNLIHVEGCHLIDTISVEQTLQSAKEAGSIVSFDLSNTDHIEKYRQRILSLLTAYVDILFLSDQESYALTHLPPEKAGQFLKNYCKITIIKTEAEGCWISSKDGIFHSPAIASQTIDRAKACDLFASGFLYGLLQGQPLERCAYFGHLLDSSALPHDEAAIPHDKWSSLTNLIHNRCQE